MSPKFVAPGPGNYKHVSEDAVYSAAPKFGMSKSSRGEGKKKDGVPGPGVYDIRGNHEGPQWKFGSSSREASPKNKGASTFYDIPGTFAPVSRTSSVDKSKLSS
jgi:hypothetical protein